MEFKEDITTQLNEQEPLTEEVIGKLSNPEFSSGRKVAVGDKVIFAWITTETENNGELNLTLLKVHPDELDVMYEYDEEMYGERRYNGSIPYLKLKQNG